MNTQVVASKRTQLVYTTLVLLRGGYRHLSVVEPITIPAEIVVSFVKTKFLLVDIPVLDNSVCCC
jgi:hypothetical protein